MAAVFSVFLKMLYRNGTVLMWLHILLVSKLFVEIPLAGVV